MLRERLTIWLGVDDSWVRPRPRSLRRDVVTALVVALFGLVEIVLLRSVRADAGEVWQLALAATGIAAAVLVRRHLPVATLAWGGAYLFVVPVWVTGAGSMMTVQIGSFLLILSGMAWARDRRAMALTASAVLAAMVMWMVWTFAVSNGIAQLLERVDADLATDGPLPAPVAFSLYLILMNTLYYAGAMSLGQLAWRQARSQALVEQQSATITQQQTELKDQAVVEERLRIARELHDVVAHHVSVMGIQAAGARRVLTRNPDAAASALHQVEESSRRAVAEMRELLGTLRSEDPDSRSAPPRLDTLAEVASAATSDSVTVTHQLVEEPDGASARLPEPVSLSLYRIAQEAVANACRHSTARRIRIVARVNARDGFAEVEVVNDGRALLGTSGTGLGIQGMRERVRALNGTCDIGPRDPEGYRVRARVPIPRKEE